ncbi:MULTISPECIES: hypothetical protein [unclassified Leptolyngbya]|uniref:hypothetical protein n=1 Tax=unclassified Leptolyngbya TaxID=2650499 RepID=UPI0016868DA5|nr:MULTISPECIES: hypothetical protein [unclassified Leptolyngbya]MBD1913099.1 hypothetical protein [Leptolyngbya sp. FACHB-8]MBD2155556.1 hypothetical protein [Leptolyngbya sp. FACHB-16]
MKRLWKILLGILLGFSIAIAWGTAGQAVAPRLESTIKVYDSILGSSTRYIGACEGNVGFNMADLSDLGINTYRIYGGMSRWETEDDDGSYGLPSIAQIKANPNVIPWEHWDEVMTHPESGSDYTFSGASEEVWQGNARTIFESLKQAHIRPVVTIRNSDPGWQPDWALQLNPPRTEADWNEWWEHVFATVYWLNVRNDYQVDDFEIHNEPDNRQQGWGGNQEDYFELVRVGADAIAHVYQTYLPDRQFHIHAPKTTGGSSWPVATLASVPDYFDSVNVHNYDLDISGYVRQVRQWMQGTIHARSPLWLGEWGTYTGGYNDLSFSLNLVRNMIRASQPGETYIYGSHLFSLYDWGRSGQFAGLVDGGGDRRLSYYAFRMGIRALQGGRPVFLTTSSDPEVMAIATQDGQQQIHLLLVNDSDDSQVITADLASLVSEGEATLWEFSEQVHDEVAGQERVHDGIIRLELPAHASRLAMIRSGG